MLIIFLVVISGNPYCFVISTSKCLSISWPMMTWRLPSPGHRQPWYWPNLTTKMNIIWLCTCVYHHWSSSGTMMSGAIKTPYDDKIFHYDLIPIKLFIIISLSTHIDHHWSSPHTILTHIDNGKSLRSHDLLMLTTGNSWFRDLEPWFHAMLFHDLFARLTPHHFALIFRTVSILDLWPCWLRPRLLHSHSLVTIYKQGRF